MIPYFTPPILGFGAYTLDVMLVCVVLAVVVQYQIVVRRATWIGVARADAKSIVTTSLIAGLVGCHVFDVLVYTPEKLIERPWILFDLTGGMSSFGGVLGGLAALVIVQRRRSMSWSKILRFLDGCYFAFPFTLAMARIGCAFSHDHLGISSTHWLAVRFPDGPRFDLGLLECIVVASMAGLFLLLDRKQRPTGFFFGLSFALYGPTRFAMDALRTGDVRYFGWTPGQYLSLIATAFGCAVLIAVFQKNRARVPSLPLPTQPVPGPS